MELYMGSVEEGIFFILRSTGKMHCVILPAQFGGKYRVFTEDNGDVRTALIEKILYARSVEFRC